ncbi:MAG: hypothetical protein K6F68_08190 [Clostridiales bacterium]|nr:hypothetical protein [Clostridiales bacterium]
MPTVIERIAAAEADADTLKKNAREAAAGTVAAAEDDAAQSLKIAREEAKAGLALAAAMAEKEASSERARIFNASRMRADIVLGEAEKKLDKAVDLIMDEILN